MKVFNLMKKLKIAYIWISIKKKEFLLSILWLNFFIYYIFNRKNIKKSDSYLEYNYIIKNGISCFPYSFVDNYKRMKVDILYDDIHPYVLENNFQIYFSSKWSSEKVAKYYKEISMEQNIESPHSYFSKELDFTNYDIALDIGGAEGNFSVSILNYFDKIYVFERDELWINCLKHTFKNYKQKVEIINKNVGNLDNIDSIKLDSNSTFYDKNMLVKIDVEGHELQVLEGMTSLLSQNKLITLLVCTYHKQNDASILNKFLSSFGFSNTYSNGYMCYFYDKKIKKPFLRKALMYSTKGIQI